MKQINVLATIDPLKKTLQMNLNKHLDDWMNGAPSNSSLLFV